MLYIANRLFRTFIEGHNIDRLTTTLLSEDILGRSTIRIQSRHSSETKWARS